MTKTDPTKDAELIMKLYELRREPELRKARDWWLTKFWPDSVDDFLKIGWAMGTQENNWLRQGASYWSMAAVLVLSGAIDKDLFLHPSISGEMYFLFAKVYPFLKELREKLEDPQAFGNIEQAINSTEFGRDRLQFTLKRVAAAKERMAAAKS